MTNVIPITPRRESLRPFPAFSELNALYERLEQLKADTILLQQKLDRDLQITDDASLATRRSLDKAVALVSSAEEEIMEAIADLIVEATARFIVPPK